MRDALRGRNLAHMGCLLGLIAGLSGGIALAWALILHSAAIALALIVWVGLTIVLGVVGYVLGTAMSSQDREAS